MADPKIEDIGFTEVYAPKDVEPAVE